MAKDLIRIVAIDLTIISRELRWTSYPCLSKSFLAEHNQKGVQTMEIVPDWYSSTLIYCIIYFNGPVFRYRSISAFGESRSENGCNLGDRNSRAIWSRSSSIPPDIFRRQALLSAQQYSIPNQTHWISSRTSKVKFKICFRDSTMHFTFSLRHTTSLVYSCGGHKHQALIYTCVFPPAPLPKILKPIPHFITLSFRYRYFNNSKVVAINAWAPYWLVREKW